MIAGLWRDSTADQLTLIAHQDRLPKDGLTSLIGTTPLIAVTGIRWRETLAARRNPPHK